MIEHMTIPCAIFSETDIESLRVAARAVNTEVSRIFSSLQFYLIQNGAVTLDRDKVDDLIGGLEALRKRYSDHKLGELAGSILEKIETAELQSKMPDLDRDVFLKLAQLTEG